MEVIAGKWSEDLGRIKKRGGEVNIRASVWPAALNVLPVLLVAQ